jgi:hypothetical protein
MALTEELAENSFTHFPKIEWLLTPSSLFSFFPSSDSDSLHQALCGGVLFSRKEEDEDDDDG